VPPLKPGQLRGALIRRAMQPVGYVGGKRTARSPEWPGEKITTVEVRNPRKRA